ncbi:outer membrane protein [Methylosinus sp. Sm6]|uniref:outer membrane protein n=1 Tax=Methylosinus sp. Sm6 TaxID=2866948 RepID=UPI001C9978FF|nr:outer membrane beta-barrel protein [Methylosinus sp. Sm6]MBY6240768.1 outer membrane beta-barrel protein [Methylosinus sp. Sm6]
MKAFPFAAALGVAAIGGRAAAADLAAIAPPPPPFSWTGVYLGANAGYIWGARNGIDSRGFAMLDNAPLFGATSALGARGVSTPSFNGAFGGGQIGYNYQLAPRFVVGVEADAQGTAVQGSESRYAVLTVPNLTRYSISTETQVTRNLDYLATVRGRFGFAVHPEALLYLTGGLAFGRASQTVTQTQYAYWTGSPLVPAGSNVFGFARSQYDDTRVGWAAGAGVEWAFRGNWSAKIEYLYYDLGRVRSSGYLSFNTNAIPGPGSGGTGLVTIDSGSRFNGHVLRAGLNYRLDLFHSPAAPPVVATY